MFISSMCLKACDRCGLMPVIVVIQKHQNTNAKTVLDALELSFQCFLYIYTNRVLLGAPEALLSHMSVVAQKEDTVATHPYMHTAG
jgi:hypothetical protein